MRVCKCCGGTGKEPAEQSSNSWDTAPARFDTTLPHFNGGVDPQGIKNYEPKYDDVRLTGQLLRVTKLMIDEEWRTLAEVEYITGDPPASISAQLRHLRKPRFGSHVVEKQSRGERIHGLWEYRLIWNKEADHVDLPV